MYVGRSICLFAICLSLDIFCHLIYLRLDVMCLCPSSVYMYIGSTVPRLAMHWEGIIAWVESDCIGQCKLLHSNKLSLPSSFSSGLRVGVESQ